MVLDNSFLLNRVICFASYEDMKNVIRKLDGTELNGKRIRMVEVWFYC